MKVERLGLCSPLPLELHKPLFTSRFTEVVPTVAIFAGAANRFHLNEIVRVKMEIFPCASRERIENGLPEKQEDRSGDNAICSIFFALGH